MATDKREAWRRANALMEQNRPEQALPELWSLVDRSHVVDEELVARLRLMGRAYAELQRPRAAATILLYLGQADAALRMSDSPTDQARAEIQMGRRIDAAKSYEKAGWLGVDGSSGS